MFAIFKKVFERSNFKEIAVYFVLAVLFVMAIIAVVIFVQKQLSSDSRQAQIYEAAVQIRDQHNSDPEEDVRTCLKKGDVLLVLPEGHIWSKTELISSLILKIKMTEEQTAKLTQPIERKSDKKKEKREEGEPEEKETIKMRKYRIKIESLDFNIEKLSEGQPFENKVFDWKDIVEEK